MSDFEYDIQTAWLNTELGPGWEKRLSEQLVVQHEKAIAILKVQNARLRETLQTILDDRCVHWEGVRAALADTEDDTDD